MAIMICKKCKGVKFRKSGWSFRAGKKVQKYQCKNCGFILTASK